MVDVDSEEVGTRPTEKEVPAIQEETKVIQSPEMKQRVSRGSGTTLQPAARSYPRPLLSELPGDTGEPGGGCTVRGKWYMPERRERVPWWPSGFRMLGFYSCGPGFNPGQETEILLVVWYSQKQKAKESTEGVGLRAALTRPVYYLRDWGRSQESRTPRWERQDITKGPRTETRSHRIWGPCHQRPRQDMGIRR